MIPTLFQGVYSLLIRHPVKDGQKEKNNKKVRPRTTNKSTTGTTKTFYRYQKQNGYILEPQDFKTNNQRDENSYFMGNGGKRQTAREISVLQSQFFLFYFMLLLFFITVYSRLDCNKQNLLFQHFFGKQNQHTCSRLNRDWFCTLNKQTNKSKFYSR